MDIIAHIKSQYDGLSRVQKRIADYVISQPDNACFQPLKAFAEQTGATEVTVINFTHRIGLKNFVELKQALQRHVQELLSPNDKLVRALGRMSDREASSQIGDCIENETQLVQQTVSALRGEELTAAVQMLESARHIYVMGYDIARPVAEFLVIRLEYMGLHVTQLDFGREGQLMLEASRATTDDLFVLVSFPIHPVYMESFAFALKKRQIPCMAVVNDASCNLAAEAALTLTCETADMIFYNSITAAISLMNLLCSLYAVRHQDSIVTTRAGVLELVGDVRSQAQQPPVT